MRLVVDINVDDIEGDAQDEIGRILRYWAGAMKQMDLTSGTEHQLMDSSYSPVGRLRLTD